MKQKTREYYYVSLFNRRLDSDLLGVKLCAGGSFGQLNVINQVVH
jgi:hypothetical protein